MTIVITWIFFLDLVSHAQRLMNLGKKFSKVDLCRVNV